MNHEDGKTQNNHKMTIKIKKLKLSLLCGSILMGAAVLNSTSLAESSTTKNNVAQKVVTTSPQKSLSAEEISIKSYTAAHKFGDILSIKRF